MTYTAILNSHFFLSLLSVAILFYGIDFFFFKKEKSRIAIFFVILGTLALAIIVISTLFQYQNLKKLSSENYTANTVRLEKHTEILEKYALDKKLDFRFRIDSARKVFITTGKIVNYIDQNGNLSTYLINQDDEFQRAEEVKEKEIIYNAINTNLIICRWIFGVIIFSSLLSILRVYLKIRRSKKPISTPDI